MTADVTQTPSGVHIRQWLREDEARMAALKVLAAVAPSDAWLAAGFVRNLVWDRLHGYSVSTPLNDLDVK